MAQTRYITVAELAEGYDDNVLGQLSSDTGSPIAVNESNAVLLNCIERGSADVQSHALRGGRYTATDLTDLQTDDDWSLKGLVSTLAFYYLHQVRGMEIPETVRASFDTASQTLDDLRDGLQVFNEAQAIDTGAPRVHVVTASRRAQLNLVSDSRFFPPARTTEVN